MWLVLVFTLFTKLNDNFLRSSSSGSKSEKKVEMRKPKKEEEDSDEEPLVCFLFLSNFCCLKPLAWQIYMLK